MDEVKEIKEIKIEHQGDDETKFNPELFDELEKKKYKQELLLLSKLEYENEQDRYVFENLPLNPTQKLEIIYNLIKEDSECVKIDEDLKKSILDKIN